MFFDLLLPHFNQTLCPNAYGCITQLSTQGGAQSLVQINLGPQHGALYTVIVSMS